jgi:hypothetical protein
MNSQTWEITFVAQGGEPQSLLREWNGMPSNEVAAGLICADAINVDFDQPFVLNDWTSSIVELLDAHGVIVTGVFAVTFH